MVGVFSGGAKEMTRVRCVYIYLIREARVPIKPGYQAIGYPAFRLLVDVRPKISIRHMPRDGSMRPPYMRHESAPSCKFLAKTRNPEKDDGLRKR